MPLLGLSITLIFNFPPEVAVGILLIGACPSGLSSIRHGLYRERQPGAGGLDRLVSTLAATMMTPLCLG